jgi:hypothetical protein
VEAVRKFYLTVLKQCSSCAFQSECGGIVTHKPIPRREAKLKTCKEYGR